MPNSAERQRAVGAVGLGAMGLGIAQSLLRAKLPLFVCDQRRDVAATFAETGATACATPAEVAENCDVIFSIVVSAAQTEQVLWGDGGCAAAMQPGSVFIMCSTVDPAWSASIEARLAKSGVLYLDCPISGGPQRACKGELTLMSAGVPAAYDKCQFALEAIAANIYRLGDRAGAGSKVKLINNLLCGIHGVAAAEAMALGIKEGLDPALLYEVITHSAGNSWMFENRIARVLAGDYAPLAAVDIYVKDLGLVLDMAKSSRSPLPLGSITHQMFLHAAAAGYAKEDDAAVIKIFPGVDLPESKT
jgi:L-threonate 2-dehydrogenase